MGGTHNYADGDNLTASVLNTYVRDQVIPQVTSATRPTGTQGQVIYETDTGRYLAYNGSAWMEFGRTSGNQTWTPQIDQGATTNIGKTVNAARYVQVGNICHFHFTLTLTGAGTVANQVTVTLPLAPSGYANGDHMGSGWVGDASTVANDYAAALMYTGSGSQVAFLVDGNSTRWGVTPSLALAAGDTVRGSGFYWTA